jgi:hypothetical protein
VADRAIVGVELDPPFSFFFEDTPRKLFHHITVAGAHD